MAFEPYQRPSQSQHVSETLTRSVARAAHSPVELSSVQVAFEEDQKYKAGAGCASHVC